jgi:flagellin
MAISILNNIASMEAENQLSITQMNLQKTLLQLSSGQRINTGADDAAGLAIANGLQANTTALNQSVQNANTGVGALQVADGALSQVTTLLNRAVTLATESANGTVGNSQRGALQAEYSQIQQEINRIGSTTTYNGTGVFNQTTGQSIFLSDGVKSSTITANPINLQTSSLLTGYQGTITATGTGTSTIGAGDSIAVGDTTYTFVTAANIGAAGGATAQVGTTTAGAVNVVVGSTVGQSLQNLAAAINGDASQADQTYQSGAGANPDAVAGVSTNSNGSATLNLLATPQGLVDYPTTGAGVPLTFTAATGGTDAPTVSGANLALGNTDLSTAGEAQVSLNVINNAIASVASERGNIGAIVNRLQDASNVMTDQVQNLTSAENGIMAADIPTAVSNLSQYMILDQSGISALAQANSAQQSILKLLS